MSKCSMVLFFSFITHAVLGSEPPQLSEGHYYNNEQIWQAHEDEREPPKQLELGVTQSALHTYELRVRSGDEARQYLLRINTPETAALESDKGSCTLAIGEASTETIQWEAEFDPTPCGWLAAPATSRTRWLIGEQIFLSGDISNISLATDYFGRSQGVALRRAFHYSGWFVIDPRQSKESSTTEEAQFVRGLTLHTEGAKQELIRPNGISTGIEVELAALTYQGTGAQILKLALYRKGETRAFTYIWSENGANRLGINLRWIQVGLTREG